MTEIPIATTSDVLHPTVATINLRNLRHNARILRERAGRAEIIAVVKADAYGHGAVPVARALQHERVHQFAVAILPEAMALRDAGVEDEILVFGAPLANQLPAYRRYDLQISVTSAEVAEWVMREADVARPTRVHAKVDTGMNRLGMDPKEAVPIIDRLSNTPGVILEAVWTHLATADEPANPFTRSQIDVFRAVLSRLRERPQRVHVANSAGLLLEPETLRFDSDVLARPGLALYGLMPDAAHIEAFNLRPVMTFRTRVQHVQVVHAGETVSYGRRWTAQHDTAVATIGVGYADGYPRLLSGRSDVLIAGRRRPVAGTICMDMTMVDLGPVRDFNDSVRVGDEVILFGEDGPSAVELARWAETIPYEICCGVARRVPRLYSGAE